MAKVLKTLRNNWKKTVFFTGAGIYGVRFGNQKWTEHNLMKEYCREAAKYGAMTIGSASTKPYHATVILNPAASGGKARTKFEKYCAPILHLAGLKVSVIRTEGQGQAKTIMEVMEDTDAVLVAGGDGTLMETVTGFLRRKDADSLTRTLPIGILPVGTSNRMAWNLFPDNEFEVALQAEAAMSVVRQLYRPVGVIEVRNASEDDSVKGKALYGLRQVQVGAFTDAHDRMDKYWYWPFVKKYMTYLFGYTTAAAKIMWSVPSKLDLGQQVLVEQDEQQKQQKPESSSSWWSYIVPSGKSKVENTESVKYKTLWQTAVEAYKGCEITIESMNNFALTSDTEAAILKVSLGPEDSLEFTDFVSEGWRRERTKASSVVPESWLKFDAARSVMWHPDPSLNSVEDDEKFFYLDNEGVDIKGSLELSLLPEKIVMFCSSRNVRGGTESQNNQNPDSDKKWWQRTQVPIQKFGQLRK